MGEGPRDTGSGRESHQAVRAVGGEVGARNRDTSCASLAILADKALTSGYPTIILPLVHR